MASADRRSVRPPLLLLLLLVTSSLLSTGLCDIAEEFSICNLPCCNVEPNCSSALQVICDCRDDESISLHRGDIPKSVRRIDITAAAQVTIHENAFLDLTSLVTVRLDLRYSGRLNIKTGGFALTNDISMHSVVIENMKDINIPSSAFSGFWKDTTKIIVRSVQNLHIHENAFHWTSADIGPSLTISRIQALQLSSNALRSPIKLLTLRNVNMMACVGGSMGEHISNVELSHVSANEVQPGCITGSESSGRISVISSHLGNIETQGISGHFREVKIQNTNVTAVRENGLTLQVAKLYITDSQIHDLMSNGLNVMAEESIHLERVTIDKLRKHGLASLQVVNKQTGDRPPMRIRNLKISQTGQGSLTFAKEANPSFRRLDVIVPDPPICPEEKWVRWLVGTNGNDQQTQVERNILQQLQHKGICPKSDEGIRNSETLHQTNPANAADKMEDTHKTDMDKTSQPSSDFVNRDTQSQEPTDAGEQATHVSKPTAFAWLKNSVLKKVSVFGVLVSIVIVFLVALVVTLTCIKRKSQTKQQDPDKSPAKQDHKGKSSHKHEGYSEITVDGMRNRGKRSNKPVVSK